MKSMNNRWVISRLVIDYWGWSMSNRWVIEAQWRIDYSSMTSITHWCNWLLIDDPLITQWLLYCAQKTRKKKKKNIFTIYIEHFPSRENIWAYNMSCKWKWAKQTARTKHIATEVSKPNSNLNRYISLYDLCTFAKSTVLQLTLPNNKPHILPSKETSKKQNRSEDRT